MDSKNKTLEEMLLEYAGKPGSGISAKNYAAFLARWDEIRAAHDKGWSYSDIWKTLQAEGIINFSYPAFTGYVRKAKRKEEEAEKRDKKGAFVSRKTNLEQSGNPRSPTKVDLPVFGQNVKPRDPKRF